MGESTSGSIKIAETARASTHSQIRMSTWGIGNRISSIQRDSISIAQLKNTKESSWMGRNTVEGSIIIEVELSMMANGTKIVRMDSAFILT